MNADFRKELVSNRSYWVRPLVQITFVFVSLAIGVQFHNFLAVVEGNSPFDMSGRPAAVDAYLPISSLMSLLYLFRTGEANPVHPAGLIIFTLSLVICLAFGRVFCSWVCPVGFAEECAHKTGKRLFGRNFRMPRWLDWLLRSIKYLLLGFFVVSILRMPVHGLREFIYGPYNRMADAKMYLFFQNITIVGIGFILLMGVLSVLFANFWCRYLCPYGALLGMFSFLSPTAVRRDGDKCSGCGGCSKACPNGIDVKSAERVRSAECAACFECVRVCGGQEALTISAGKGKTKFSPLVYGIVIVLAFYGGSKIAESLQYWQTDTPAHAYRAIYRQAGEIEHP